MTDIILYTGTKFDFKSRIGAWLWLEPNTGNFDTGIDESTTENRLELIAVIEAIRSNRKHFHNALIRIYCKSTYCVNGFNIWVNGWRRSNWMTKSGDPVKNKDLWQELDRLRRNVHLIYDAYGIHSDNREKIDETLNDTLNQY